MTTDVEKKKASRLNLLGGQVHALCAADQALQSAQAALQHAQQVWEATQQQATIALRQVLLDHEMKPEDAEGCSWRLEPDGVRCFLVLTMGQTESLDTPDPAC